MLPNLSVYYLRFAIAGIVSGLIVVGSPDLNMRWQGIVLILVGMLSLALWARNPNPFALDKPRPVKESQGPSFDIHDRDPSIETPTTSHLIDEIRRNRTRQKRAKE
jgi:hypothetical protein